VVRVQVSEAGRRLCDVHPQTGQVGAESRFHHAGAGWARPRFRRVGTEWVRGVVPPCGRGMGAVPDPGAGRWERDKVHEMRCGHRARELRPETDLGPK
jgi:hypothetical protein